MNEKMDLLELREILAKASKKFKSISIQEIISTQQKKSITIESILLKLLDDTSSAVKTMVAESKIGCDYESVLDKMTEAGQDSNLKIVLVSNNHLPNTYLRILARDKNWLVRQAVAKCARTSRTTLDFLSNDSKLYVVLGVAQNINTSSRTLEKLSESKEMWVRKSVAANVSTPNYVLKRLLQDNNIFVVQAAENNLNKK